MPTKFKPGFAQTPPPGPIECPVEPEGHTPNAPSVGIALPADGAPLAKVAAPKLVPGSAIAKVLARIWRGHETTIVDSPPGAGKGLALDTPIPTPSGWTTMSELNVGDWVFNEQGYPCQVTFKSPVRHLDCYEVSTDDGHRVIADGDHLWLANIDRGSGPIPHYPGKSGPKPKRQSDGFSTYNTRTLAKKRNKRPLIPIAKSLDLPDVHLPIEPYTLGYWLGDGNSRNAIITSHEDDMLWLMPELQRLNPQWDVHEIGVKQQFIISGGLQAELRRIGVLGCKSIPREYFRASKSQRQALLQGLIDSDGYVSKTGFVEFSNKNVSIAKGVRELALSLGVKASMATDRSKLNGVDCGPRHRVTFYYRHAARMPRKAERCRDGVRTYGRYLTVTPVASTPTQCIQVGSPSRLYLAGEGMMVTHNTELVTTVVANLVERVGLVTLIATPTRAQALSLLHRLVEYVPMEQIGLEMKDVDPADLPDGWAERDDKQTKMVFIATLAKAKFIDKSRPAIDVVVVDEAYQATHAAVRQATAGIGQILMVGDPGQIGPVVTVDTSIWEGMKDAPHLPAPKVEVGYDDVERFSLNTTYRLGPKSAAIIAPIYDFPFMSGRPERSASTNDGEVVDEIESFEVAHSDEVDNLDCLATMVERAARFVGGTLLDSGRTLVAEDIALVVSRNSQVSILTGMSSALGHEFTIGTADRLQGGEWPIVIALDSIYGSNGESEHNQSVGRLCVMVSRHTTHLSWFHDDSWVEATAGNGHDNKVSRQVREALTGQTADVPGKPSATDVFDDGF